MRDAGDTERGEGSEQSAGEPPTRGVEGGRVRPDIMILEGWPETSPPPQGPSKTYISEPQTTGIKRANANKRGRHEERRVTIIIGELGFSSDLNPQKTVERKQHKYAPLIVRRASEGGLER